MNKGQVNGLISPILERSRLKDIAKYVKGPKLLDVGCGRCALKNYLNEIEYHGLERDTSIDVPNDTKVFYCDVVGDLGELGVYDSIVMAEVIEHLEDPKKALLSLKRHLNDDGIIIISTSVPFRYKLHRYTSKMGLTDKGAEHEHKSLFGKKELYVLAKECDLKVKRYIRTEFWSKQIVILGI